MQQDLASSATMDLDHEQITLNQLTLIAEVSPTGMLVINHEGNIVLTNETIERIFGYSKAEMIGQPIEIFVPEKVRERHVDRRNNFIAHPKPLIMGEPGCLKGQRKDGTAVFVEIGLQPIETPLGTLVLAAVADVTKQEQIRNQLNETHSLLQAIMDNTSYIIIAATRDGSIQLFNKAAEQLLGYSSEEIIGRNVALLHDDSEVAARAEELTAELGRTVEPGFDSLIAKLPDCDVEEREWTLTRKDGSQFPVLLVASSIHDSNGSIMGYMEIAKDITIRRQAEERLREAKQAAEMANKAKSEFLSAMSHELRTPLNAIIGFSQGLIERSDRQPLNEHQKDRINKIHQSGIHLLTLINDILDITKIESGKMAMTFTTFDIRELLSDIYDMTIGLGHEKPAVVIRLDLGDDLPPITTDREKVKQILINLAGNAVKFTREGTITLSVRLEDDHFVFSVTDTGIGIPDDELEQVFEKFHQIRGNNERTMKGSGLGLTISRRFAEMLGGSLNVSSTLGQGSIFSLRLPRHAKPPEPLPL